MSAPELLRATVLHTPRNPFTQDNAFEAYEDGGLLIENGRVLACGRFAQVAVQYPHARVRDVRGSIILPGFIDTHIHFPQTRIIGGLGWSLLEWLDRHALPEEVHMGDPAYAAEVAEEFVRALAAHGTTTALVFGSHFREATHLLFEAAARKGLRIATGLIVSDTLVPHPLRQTPEAAYRDSAALIEQHHGRHLLRYAVTPRFALSATEPMLEVCARLMRDYPGVLFQTHLSENRQEIADVLRMFSWAKDYLEVYEHFHLSGPRSLFAHNVHTSPEELHRLAKAGASIAHCPASNAALGSGIFPMRHHLHARVKFGLGTDVGAGTGFGMLKEALQCYLAQRLHPEGVMLSPAHLLYLATKAGAEALGLENETGDFTPGKSADFVRLLPPIGSTLAGAVARAQTPERLLAVLITMAGAESIREVQVQGREVH